MGKKFKIVAFIFPGISILSIIIIYSKLSGTENVKYIHIVTLISLGMAIGIFVRNIVANFWGRL